MFIDEFPPEKITVDRREYENEQQELADLRQMRDAVERYFRKNAPELSIIFKQLY